ncbi:DegT/DnrJ/EryC1/StrS family aminotransferase [Pendulispora albinea]|uniref:DegT/DnrJ/EryC1/StrS family aminotransferase n=1 Tax=Pendulispora albinea TaxID=2741071 RepID=A0ABZ2M1R5_9BACT
MSLVFRSIPDTYRYSSTAREAELLTGILGKPLSGNSEPVEAYESELARYFGAKHAVAVSSGSAAVMAGAAALDLRPGDEVVLTPTCPLCTVYPLQSMGLVPVFADTQPTNFSIDLDDLARVVGPKTRAIIDIPMWGYPVPVKALRAAADAYGLPLLLDLAHGHGVTVDGKPLWTYGDVATFSTHDSKILSTGEGGFVLTDRADCAERARGFTRFGNLDGVHLGINLKLSGLQAELGRHRLSMFDASLEKRLANARRVLDGIAHPVVSELSVVPGGKPNYFTLLLQLPSTETSERFISHLAQWGIPSDIAKYGCRPLYEFPLLRSFARDCSNAKRLLGTITTIPIHPSLSEDDLDHIVRVINVFGTGSSR